MCVIHRSSKLALEQEESISHGLWQLHWLPVVAIRAASQETSVITRAERPNWPNSLSHLTKLLIAAAAAV